MKNNLWFRMYSDFLEDTKMISLAFEDQRHFIGVLALKSSGLIDQECSPEIMDRLVAQKLWVDRKAISEVKRRLVDAGLIDAAWQPLDWNPHQSGSADRPPSHEWKELRSAVFVRDDFTCQYCGARGVNLECDHVHPVSKGGGHDLSNLVTACFSCNRSKRDKTLSEWGWQS